MPTDTVTMLRSTAEAIRSALGEDMSCAEMPERMAWIVAVLKELPDSDEAFPHGKWATIQALESQVQEAAAKRAAEGAT
jgi:hypothetical protein